MESFEGDNLAATLSTLRPTPRAEFAAELDRRAAAGFPRRSAGGTSPLARPFARLRAMPPRRFALPAAGTAVVALAVATAVVATIHSGSRQVADNRVPTVISVSGGRDEPAAEPRSNRTAKGRAAEAEEILRSSDVAKLPQPVVKVGGACESGTAGCSSSGEFNGEFFGKEAASAAGAGGETVTRSSSFKATAGAASGPYASQAHHRDVERSAELTLGADPAGVGEDSAKVFEAVHAVNGIVLNSSTSGGPPGDAGASFDLLVPSARLGDALAAFSGIDEVRSRHEATNDITAPTIGLGERLQDSNAKIEGLLKQLAASETEAERDAVEAELRVERARAANLRAGLSSLQRKASFSRVSLRIETGVASTSSRDGSWGVGDALAAAGYILAVAAGVAIVGLAILAPLALIALLVWLGSRVWVRRSRERALG